MFALITRRASSRRGTNAFSQGLLIYSNTRRIFRRTLDFRFLANMKRRSACALPGHFGVLLLTVNSIDGKLRLAASGLFLAARAAGVHSVEPSQNGVRLV
jgi:hypothetical protein